MAAVRAPLRPPDRGDAADVRPAGGGRARRGRRGRGRSARGSPPGSRSPSSGRCSPPASSPPASAARSRALFYAAYALFAVTAAKVVIWDLATSPPRTACSSFLALGRCCMAGAYLNLRFRQRLMPEPRSP